MNAMQTIEQDGFWREARRICDEHDFGAESLERIAHGLRFSAFQKAIEPYISLKVRLFNFKMPKYLMHADGRFETIVEWTEAEKEALAKIDELIAAEARRLGLPHQESGDHA